MSYLNVFPRPVEISRAQKNAKRTPMDTTRKFQLVDVKYKLIDTFNTLPEAIYAGQKRFKPFRIVNNNTGYVICEVLR
jgi:hypothetical protein